MPFVTIRILAGHSQARKDEMSRRVTDAISEVAGLTREIQARSGAVLLST